MLINIALIQIFWCRLLFINWLQKHLIPCPFKYLTGIDCPGCGFQRSVLALVQGNLHESIMLYPPAIPLIVFFIYCLADKFYQFDTGAFSLKNKFFALVALIVILNYGFKMWGLFHNYTSA